MQGRRAPDETHIFDLKEGEYCRRGTKWWARPPGTEEGHVANLSNHEVIESPDRSITVKPSIRLSTTKAGELVELYHGFLTDGVWT